MNQNEAEINVINKSEESNIESNNENKKTIAEIETFTSSQVSSLIETKNNDAIKQNLCAGENSNSLAKSTEKMNSNIMFTLPQHQHQHQQHQQQPPTNEYNIIQNAMLCLKDETTENSESKIVESQHNSTATTSTASELIASPIKSATAAAAAAADCRQLQHIASAPVLSCVPLRANQQQLQKIKSYHDAKQTALWDTKSSILSSGCGGAILKCGISSTHGSPKMLRKLSGSSSCNALPRRVSFPKSDNELVTGYLEPANPWEHVSSVNNVSEIADLYIKSCHKHNTRPLPDVLEQLKSVELNKLPRQPILTLKKVQLQPGDCEALEEILKRVQYKCIDLSSCELEETAISAICDIIEYYEAANELNISTNPKGMTQRGWISCAYMVGHSQELHVLNAEGNPISKISAEHLGNALNTSNVHTVKLEHCGLKGAPLSGLCMKIRHNKTLRELWLAHNDLDSCDAESIADLLKVNHFLELVDISNNNIGDDGLKHIVEALIVQSKELERRSMFQRTRATAIDDDIFLPVETMALNADNTTNNKEQLSHVFENTNAESEESTNNQKSTDNDITSNVDELNHTTDLLIPDLDALNTNTELTTATTTTKTTFDEMEAEDDTEETVKSNTVKTKQQSTVIGSGNGNGNCGQSMLDKLLSMNSDSSSEEGVSNLSTDTIAACGSEDTASFVSDELFEGLTSTITTNTCTNSKVSPSMTTAIVTVTPTAVLPSLTTENLMMPFGNLENENVILYDTCKTEATNQFESNGDKRIDAMTQNCCHNNCNINNTFNTNNNYNNNNNNNKTHIVQKQLNENTETAQAHNHEITTEIKNPCVFEVTAEESDCLVPCTSANKSSSVTVMQNPTSAAVDVNKNTRIVDDYDDTHSTDSAFESASEGDISRTLPEEFTRLSTSLESTRLDDIAKELAIETATIATESIEFLADAGTVATIASATSTHNPPLVKIGSQKSDEVKTKDVEVRFSETAVLMDSNEPSQKNTKELSNVNKHNSSLQPNAHVENDSLVACMKSCEESHSPIPTPPPPSTSPGGASLSLRRTDTSCNFLTQSTRNHSQSSDSLCSDNSLDGSVSSDLNLSTSAQQLNEKLTKNDTLTRQQRQSDTIVDCSNRAPGGLKALAVWNNNFTKEAGLYISDLLADTTSLELLNIGKNCLSNEFLLSIKDGLTKNTTLTTLGLQSAHLSAKGIETLSSILAFGGNSTLQRIDIRDNKLEVESLTTLADALKSNTTVMQIDIDDEPKRLSVGSDAHLDYVRVVENIRSMCSRNEKSQAQMQAEKAANTANSLKRRGGYYVGSRKISLTCHSRPLIEYSVAPAVTMPSMANKLEVKRKTGARLRSPVPSPPTISPSSSPNRSRFQVFRVNEVSPLSSPSSTRAAPISNLSSSADSTQPNMMPLPSSTSLTSSTSLPSMATVTSSTQTIRRHANSPRSRFHVSKIYEDPKVPLSKRSLPPITPPIHLPPTPMIKSAPKDDGNCLIKEIDNLDCVTDAANEQTEKPPLTPPPLTPPPPSRCPIAVFNENDITLTHSSANDMRLSTIEPSLSPPVDNSKAKEEVSAVVTDCSALSAAKTQQIERKVSWIGNPTAVEKLLTLFQNPVTIFQRSSSPEPKNVPTNISAATTESTSTTSQTIPSACQTQIATIPSAKQSPPTWSKFGSDILLNVSAGDAEKTLTIEQPKSFLGAASKQLRDFGKQVFRQNATTVPSESYTGSTDSLLNITPTILLEGGGDNTISKLENNDIIELRPTEMITSSSTTTAETTTTTTTTTESIENVHHNPTSLSSEAKTEKSVALLSEDIKPTANE